MSVRTFADHPLRVAPGLIGAELAFDLTIGEFGESLERFVGYLHIPGSLGLSLVDLWREPNRRMPHDRVAHTAVVRVVRLAGPGA